METLEISGEVYKKAIRILRRNYGCPGQDGIRISDIKKDYSYHLCKLQEYVFDESIYREIPSQVEIIDYRKNARNIYVYSIYSRWYQQCIRILLEEKVKKVISSYVYGYRKGINENDLYSEIITNNKGSLLYLDILKYYESVSVNILKSQLLKLQVGEDLTNTAIALISYSYSGIPAGNALSPTLSNIYLHSFDLLYPSGYARFGDDLYFYNIRSNTDKVSLLESIQKNLQMLQLEVNSNKTRFIVNPLYENITNL